MKTMIEQIKQLLQNSQVAEAIKSVTNQAEATKILVAAGEKNGYVISFQDVSRALSELSSTGYSELSEADLLSVSGGMMAAVTGRFGHTCCWSCNRK